MGEESKVYEVLVGQREGKRSLGRPRRRLEEGLEWILGRSAGGVDWIRMAQDMGLWRAVVNAVMNLRVLAPLSYKCIEKSMKTKVQDAHIKGHVYVLFSVKWQSLNICIGNRTQML
jgi:hypothetical protein